MISFKDVTKKYGEKTALANVSFNLPETGLVVLKGKNGSGKSTIMNLLGGLDIPTSGVITVDKENISETTEENRRKYREEKVAFIFQENNLFEEMTVEENLLLTNPQSNYEKIAEFLEIKDLLKKKAKELSGGEQQRVSIARALLRNSKIILADEPTSSIDATSKIKILNLLKKLSERVLVILIIHDTELIPEYADIVLELDNGSLVGIQKRPDFIERDNVAKPYKNNFNPLNFAKKNLFLNKKKLVRTCVLLIFSFLFVLIATSVASINYKDMHADTLTMEKDGMIMFYKLEEMPTGGFFHEFSPLLDEDIEYLEKNKISDSPMMAGTQILSKGYPLTLTIGYNNEESKIPYYRPQISWPMFYSIDALKNVDYGRKPIEKDEVIISSYMAEQIMFWGMRTKEGLYYYPDNFEKLISDQKELEVLLPGDQKYYIKISGIVNVNLDKFAELKNEANYNTKYEIFQSIVLNTAKDIYVRDDFYDLFKDLKPSIKDGIRFSLDLGAKNPYGNKYKGFNTAPFEEPIVLKDSSIIDYLSPNEVILGSDFEESFKTGDSIDIKIENYTYDAENLKNLKIVGFNPENKTYLSKEKISAYLNPPIAKKIIKIQETDNKTVKKIFKEYPFTYTQKYITATNYSEAYESLMKFCKVVSVFFIGLSSIFAFLSIMYLYNYIQTSIDNHKKDIAVLKSLGIKTKEILKSFTIEVCAISLMSYFYALIAYLFIRISINYVAENIIGFKFNIVPINILIICLIICISIIIVILISLKNNKKIANTTPQLLLKKTNI